MYNTQSINERLRNFARENNIPNVERARVILCLERVIARLMQDEYLCSKLIFGGGFVIYKSIQSLRFTVDIDAVISGVKKEVLITKVNEALKIDLEDGFWFGDPRVKELEISSGYGGIRFKIPYKAGLPHPTDEELLRLRSVQLDVSIGANLEEVAKKEIMLPTLNIFAGVEWFIYPMEFICAEKIHALYSKGDLNTRGKDVYDLALLLPQVDKINLQNALSKTFKNRKDSLGNLHEAIYDIDTSFLCENYLKTFPESSQAEFSHKWNLLIKVIKELKL